MRVNRVDVCALGMVTVATAGPPPSALCTSSYSYVSSVSPDVCRSSSLVWGFLGMFLLAVGFRNALASCGGSEELSCLLWGFLGNVLALPRYRAMEAYTSHGAMREEYRYVEHERF